MDDERLDDGIQVPMDAIPHVPKSILFYIDRPEHVHVGPMPTESRTRTSSLYILVLCNARLGVIVSHNMHGGPVW